MVIIDDYAIDAAIAEHIEKLDEQGRLEAVTPEREFGYTCQAVYGVHGDQVAAIHVDPESWKLNLLQLWDGRLISGDPGHIPFVVQPPATKAH